MPTRLAPEIPPAPLWRRWLLGIWHFLMRPSGRWSLATLVAVGLVVGVAGTGAVGGAMYFTSTNTFCISCHTNDAAKEWAQSPHHRNAVGFVAGCADCHEPHDFVGMITRKIAASNELWNQILGTINTPQKYEAHRLELAQREWARMRANHSAECMTCHQPILMNDPDKAFLRDMHRTAIANGQNCIDCHKGVAHVAPVETTAAASPP